MLSGQAGPQVPKLRPASRREYWADSRGRPRCPNSSAMDVHLSRTGQHASIDGLLNEGM